MKELACLLILLSCPVNLFSQIDSSTYEWAMISRGDNYPDFNPTEDGLKALIISLHMQMQPEALQKMRGWSAKQYAEKVNFLKSKDYVYEKEGKIYPSCMVVSDREGKELYKYADPLSQKIAASIISSIEAIKRQYLQTEVGGTTDFNEAAFFVLSNVMLDNWQISNVEKEFLAKERPLRHGKHYYFAYLQNLNPPRESFGIYGNGGFDGFGVYGNNRKTINQSQSKERLNEMTIVSEKDNDIFNDMASSFTPTLIGLLKQDKNYIEEVYKKTGYSNEVSFEEFFIWWYHFIYTRATNILAEKNQLTIPEHGNFFYRHGSAAAQSSTPAPRATPSTSPAVDQVLERYLEAVGGRTALMRLSSETRKGELRAEGGGFAMESYALATGQWAFTLKSDQRRLQIQCNRTNCWRNGNQSDKVDPLTFVGTAAGLDLHFPIRLKEYFSSLQFVGREALADKKVDVLEGSSPSLKPFRIAFDAQTGLLVQLGPTEFQNYRDCSGVKRPFVSISPADGKTIFSEIQHNQPIPAEINELLLQAAAQSCPQ